MPVVYLGGDPRKHSREVEDVRTGSEGRMIVATMGNWNPVLLGKTSAGSGACTCQTYPFEGGGGRDLGIDPPTPQLKAAPRCCYLPGRYDLGQAWIKWGLVARESPQAEGCTGC